MITLQSEAPTSRKNRGPRHNFGLRLRPFQVVPFMIAPVLPAETLESVWFEAREVTDPLQSPLLGFKSEYHFFYVKIRDITNAAEAGQLSDLGEDDAETILKLFTEPLTAAAGITSAASADYMHNGGGVNWTKHATEVVVRHHFRDRGEAPSSATIGNYWAAQIREQLWLDSLTPRSGLDQGGTTIGDPGVLANPEDLQEYLEQYEALRAYSWTDMSFEDYLATHGIRVNKAELNIPERLFSLVKWTYPSNTINPSDGAPTSACSWVFKEMKRDKKAFREPGFILGLHVIRPKVYFDAQTGALAHWMDRGLLWLPAYMKDAPATSIRQFDNVAATDGPLGTTPSEDYLVDMRDLLMHGDQFFNYTEDATAPRLELPTAALVRKYPSSADVDTYFKSASPANQVRVDGFAQLTISGWQQDYTRGTVAGNV